ncbi:ferritin-like domain-containing protein [Nocardia sp. bgisy118]|uniref:ferritin-like domain-containing protein n=1 Tax=Nocardia sp. bgisy118 TaxID=3413786 RepID=UPI003F4A70E2
MTDLVTLEHATSPPRLCALYSLDPGRNAEAAQVIGSVFVEEMLHLALAERQAIPSR